LSQESRIGKAIVEVALCTNSLHKLIYIAKVSNWLEDEKTLIAKAKLQGIALHYVQGRELLAIDACLYAILREHLAERFSEKSPAHNYTQLQDAMQEKEKV